MIEEQYQKKRIHPSTNIIKVIQLTIRPEQYNQSNMTSNTIRTNPGVVTVTSSVALMRRPETQTKPDVQEADVGR